ncbi:MAG TPA: hypothetical protein VMT10_12780 [Solirubrobacteraceae bacterium]|nr:hypothetical protein [Solirubrobacteraceae bacterium]
MRERSVKAVDINGGRPETTQSLFPATLDATLGDLAVGPRGGVAIAGIAGSAPSTTADPATGLAAGQQRLYLSTRASAAATFAAPEAISGQQRITTPPALGIDPVTARLVALWQPVGQPDTYAARTPIEPTPTTARARSAARTSTSRWTSRTARRAAIQVPTSMWKRELDRAHAAPRRSATRSRRGSLQHSATLPHRNTPRPHERTGPEERHTLALPMRRLPVYETITQVSGDYVPCPTFISDGRLRQHR